LTFATEIDPDAFESGRHLSARIMGSGFGVTRGFRSRARQVLQQSPDAIGTHRRLRIIQYTIDLLLLRIVFGMVILDPSSYFEPGTI
jgi:hypothetical protein